MDLSVLLERLRLAPVWRSSERHVLVGSTPMVVAAGTNYRKGIILSNGSNANSIFVGRDSTVAVGSGIQLSPTFPTLRLAYPLDGDSSWRELWAIAGSAAAAAQTGTPASVAAQVTSAIGPQLTYTVPVGATAVCWGMVRSNVSASTKASYQPVITTGGQAVPYAAASSVSVITESFEVPLAAGDSVSWVCTSAGSASVDQLQIFVTQFTGASVSGTATLTIWDLEECGCIP